MTTTIRFSTQAGGHIEGALSEPPGTALVGAVVVVHEWHGLNEVMKTHAARFAEAGFLALVPDLSMEEVASNDEEAAKMIGAFDFQKAVGEIGAAAAHLRSHPRSNGKVAVAGFCLGGALTLAAARYVQPLQAAVPFYGLPRLPAEEFSNVKTPICGHYAKVDEWANPALAEQFQAKVRSGGGQMDLYIYDAPHAFMRSTDAARYEPKSAALAWERTIAFLGRHLG